MAHVLRQKSDYMIIMAYSVHNIYESMSVPQKYVSEKLKKKNMWTKARQKFIK